LTGFLREHLGRSVFTDTFPSGRDRPPAISLIWAPKLEAGKGITVQWAIQNRLLRISREKFYEYLSFKRVPPSSVVRGLKAHLNMTENRGSLGANTPYNAGAERLLCIPVPEGSALEDQMLVHTAAVNGPATESGPPDTSPQKPQPLAAL